MTKKRFLGVVIAVLLAAALLLGVWWLIARPAASDPALKPQESHDPYAGLSETAIPYAMRQSTPFSRGNPPAIPAELSRHPVKAEGAVPLRLRPGGAGRGNIP